MTTKTDPVSKDQWEKHKSTILELYCKNGLPLTQGKNAPDEHRCVDWIMKHQHGFVASKSQYEAQLRFWGATKNLKQREWVSLLLEFDRLELQGKDVRIVISGKIQTREKINKSRHRYMRNFTRASSTASHAQGVASNSHSFVEVNQDGQWSRYRGENAPGEGGALASGSGVPPHDSDGREEATSSPGTMALSQSPRRQMTPHWVNAMLAQTGMELDIPSEPDYGSREIGPTYRSISGFTNWNGFDTSPGSGLEGPSFSQDLSFYFNLEEKSISPQVLQAGMQDGDELSSVSTSYRYSDNWATMNASSSSSPDAPADPQTALALMLLGRSKPAGVRNSTGNIDVRGLADQFTSLLSDTSVFWSTRHSTVLVQPNSVNDPVLFNILLYSIINGFAGLEGVPSASVLGVLRENRGFFSHISKLILSGPDSMAKPIVDNLFPAALQAGDAEAVALLLQATQNHRGISVDLNKSVFRVLGKIYKPLELAVDSGSTEVIGLMLEAGADPNRKFLRKTKNGYVNTTLSLVGSKGYTESEYPMLDVVRMLLNHGAEIDKISIRGAVDVSGNNPMVLKELIQGIHPSKHAIWFSCQKTRPPAFSKGEVRTLGRYNDQIIVEDMVRLTDNLVVTSLVKDVVGQCTSTNCKKCILDNPEAVNNMVLQAAKRDNLELVEFLAQYATSLHEALAGAVKSGNYELITFLLDNGARADGPAVRVVTNNMMSTEPSTPLAEAIRQGDDKLVHTLADYGAWRRLDDEDHWDAAISAAAEVGSVRYLEEALRSVTPAKLPSPRALKNALTKGKSQIALALLRAGVPASETELLSLALKMRNKSVVDALLDCVVKVEIDVLGQAAEWGDVDIIDALVSRGADLDDGNDTTALAAAVASQNRQLVDHILDLGADPGAKAQNGRSPLGEAVKNNDHPMIDYLLSKGATPADTSAFLAATQYDQGALVKLSSAFKQKYPLGLKGFGTELLAKAIGANDAIGVRFLLDLKVNTTSMVHAVLFDRPHLETFDFFLYHLSPLGFAILNTKAGDIQVVDLLLRAGAPANAIAAQYHEGGHKSPLLLAIETRNTPTVNLLLENGADINHPARRGVLCTPLQKACKIGSYDMVELLLQNGAHVNSPAARRWGGTALQFAARSGSLKIVELLLLNNADPHAPASEFGWGGTAFEFAAEFGRYHVLLHLWKTSPPEGFTAAILHSARDRAEENGHRGCVDFITQIMRDASFERLV